jgi:hypothetical protein
MDQRALQLQVITPAAAAHMALLGFLWPCSPPRGPSPQPALPSSPLAVDFLTNQDFVSLLLPKHVCPRRVGKVIVGFCSLFSACKGTRKLQRHFINAIQRLIDNSNFQSLLESDWKRMEGLPLGEHLMLLQNFYTTANDRRVVRFLGAPPHPITSVSATAPFDLSITIQGFNLASRMSWRDPFSVVGHWFLGVLWRYQLTGNVYEMLKYGFSATSANRLVVRRAVHIIRTHVESVDLVTDDQRLATLDYMLDHSFDVVDLNPEHGVRSNNTNPPVPLLTGFHVGFNVKHFSYFNGRFANSNNGYQHISCNVLHRLRNE